MMIRSKIVVSTAALMLVTAIIAIATRVFSSPPIAVIGQAAPEQLWASEHAGVSLAARELGARIYWNAPDREDDVQRQIALVEKVTQGRYQGLVLAPTQFLALMVPVERALKAGLPVVVIDSALPLPPCQHLSYIVDDEAESGRLVAERLGLILKGHGKISILGIDPNSKKLMSRLRAIESTLHHDFPNVVIADRRTGSLDDAWAQQVAQQSLSQVPDVGAIATLNVPSTIGLYRAFINMRPEKRPRVVAIDQDYDLVNLLRAGKIDSLVVSDTFDMGRMGVEQVVRMKKGLPVPPYTQIEPVLMTTENMNDPALQQRLSAWWRISR